MGPDPDLSQIWLFSGGTTKEKRALRKALEQVSAKSGKVLCTEGTTGHEFFYIVDGEAVVRRNNRKVNTLGPGQYFGELALIDRQPRSATVVADTDMDLLVLGHREFTGLLTMMPELSRKILVAMAARLRDADTKASDHI
jgi:CRP/FNR family transcriptional regulator, cyclic AMP receptor protein